METLIGLIVFGLIIGIPLYKIEHTINNRISPPGQKTDYGAMNRDLTNGMSKNDVKDKFNRAAMIFLILIPKRNNLKIWG